MNDAVTALPLIGIALVLVLLYSAISILMPLPPFKRRRQAFVCAFLASLSLALAGSLTESPTAPIPPAIQSSEIEPTDIESEVPIEEKLPVIQPSEIEPNVSKPVIQTQEEKITCDVFEIKSHINNDQLFLSLDTDCPDYSEITILIYRTFYEVETLNAYSRNYFQEKSTVGNWRSQRIISVNHANWLDDLETHRQEMIRFGSGFTVDRVGDDIEIIVVVPINQEDERFGRRNSNLVGKAVNATGLRIIKREVSINYPIQESSDVIAMPPDSNSGTPDLEPVPPTNDTAGMALTKRAQQLLGKLGFDPGPLDGVMGPTTKAAVRSFQETNGIRVDGTITDALVEAMESQSAAATPEVVTDEPQAESPAAVCPTLDEDRLTEVAQWLDMGVSDDNIGSLFKITPACAKQWREAVER